MKKYKIRNFRKRPIHNGETENVDLEKLILKVFLKHVKDNNLYIAFRWSVNRENANKDLIHIISANACTSKYYESNERILRIGCSFTSARSLNDIISIMRVERGTHKVENNKQFQMSLMNMVNMLIHSCIEHSIKRDMQILEKIGSAVFEEVGKNLFGESFKDMTEDTIDPRQREFIEKMKDSFGMEMPSREDMDRFMRLVRGRINQEQEQGVDMEVDFRPRQRLYMPYVDDFEDYDYYDRPF